MKVRHYRRATHANTAAYEYKHLHSLPETTLELLASVSNERIGTTIIDGEINACHYKRGHAFLGNIGKRVRYSIGVTHEIEKMFPKLGIHNAVFMGHLMVLGKDGHKMQQEDFNRIIRHPTPTQEERIRFAVYDIVEINGMPVKERYWKRASLINHLFKGAKYIEPVIAARVEESIYNDISEKEVFNRTLDSICLERGEREMKIKITTPQNLVVIGVIPLEKKKTVSAIAVAYMDGNSHYRFAGTVSVGLTEEDKAAWYRFAILQGMGNVDLDGLKILSVKPLHVVQIRAERIKLVNREVLENTSNGFMLGPFKALSAVLEHPRYTKQADNKGATPQDVGLKQIPDWEGEVEVTPPPLPRRENPLPPNGQSDDLAPPQFCVECGAPFDAFGQSHHKDTCSHFIAIQAQKNPAQQGKVPMYLEKELPATGAFQDTLLGSSLVEGFSLGDGMPAAVGGELLKRMRVQVVTQKNPEVPIVGPLANILSCPNDGGRLVYYGRGNSPTERGVMVYRCAICHRAYRKRPREAAQE